MQKKKKQPHEHWMQTHTKQNVKYIRKDYDDVYWASYFGLHWRNNYFTYQLLSWFLPLTLTNNLKQNEAQNAYVESRKGVN